MSRFRKFAHSLLSGYVQLGANIFYTLASVPLALHYLGKEEFGLWALTTQIAGYVALVDVGLSVSASRILIDYKDHPKREEYGSVIQTGALVGLSQGGLVFIAGLIVAFAIAPLLHIPQLLQQKFFWLVVGQCGLTAATFAARILIHILTANQRFDISNYAAASSFAVNYGIMWWCLSHGFGVFSILWAQGFAIILTALINCWGGYRLGLFPRRGEWGRPSREKFHELFAFGRDFFLFAVGGQFVNASQTLLLTRLIGLDAAAVWSVCTRAYVVLTQVIYRIFDYSTSAMAEMMVHNERELLLRRFREIAVLSVNLSVAAATLFAVCNGPFVQVWTAGKIGWSAVNDLLLAIWLVICVNVRVHTGLVGQTKAFRFMKYIYFIEGLAFIGLTLLLHRFGEITMMLVISIVCSLCFTFPYGLRRTREYFNLGWSDLAEWHKSTARLVACAVPAGLLVWWFARRLPPAQFLAVELVVMGAWTALTFLRYGLGPSLRAEACRHAPGWIQPILARTGFLKSGV